MSKTLVSCAILLILAVRYSDQCSCDWGFVYIEGENVPRGMCYASKYVRVDVKTYTFIQGKDIDGRIIEQLSKRAYGVNVSMIYRSTGDNARVEVIDGGMEANMTAPVTSSMCGGVTLDVGGTYYISVYGNSMNFDVCSFIRREFEMTDVLQKMMKGELTCPTSTSLQGPLF